MTLKSVRDTQSFVSNSILSGRSRSPEIFRFNRDEKLYREFGVKDFVPIHFLQLKLSAKEFEQINLY